MKKFPKVENYFADLLIRSKQIKNIYDIFDTMHPNMTMEEVEQACLNLYALKLKENPSIIKLFEDTYGQKSSDEKDDGNDNKKKIVSPFKPVYFDVDEYNQDYDDNFALSEQTTATFLPENSVIVFNRKFMEENYKNGLPFNILNDMYHELEHLVQTYEPDEELQELYHRKRVYHYGVNEKTVEKVLRKNRGNISKAMEEFNKLPDDKKYVDYLDFVNIADIGDEEEYYNYVGFDHALNHSLPVLNKYLTKTDVTTISEQLEKTNNNFYENSPYEIGAVMMQKLFSMYMNAYCGTLNKKSSRFDWIFYEQLSKIDPFTFLSSSYHFSKEENLDNHRIVEELINDKETLSTNEIINKLIDEKKYDYDTREQARSAISDLFIVPLRHELDQEELDHYYLLLYFYCHSCHENGLLSKELCEETIDRANDLLDKIEDGTYKTDKAFTIDTVHFLREQIDKPLEEMEEEIEEDKKKKHPLVIKKTKAQIKEEEQQKDNEENENCQAY